MPSPPDSSPDPRDLAASQLQKFRSRQAHGEAEDIDEFLSKNEDLREVLENIMSETVSLPTPEGGRQKSLTKHPEWIRHYRIIGTLGEGGMGIVYLAEQQEPVKREVALKVIKLGMDTEDVLARFETERQALALMNHPSIAKVYDAGVNEQGQPYFAMELVDGIPITDFCDLYNLSLKARIQVFQKLCLGVQHAHQKSVLHRDLKPANILVSLSDGQIVVKIIDFGLARATDRKVVEQSLYTQHGRIIGTPAYMSPEQAEGRAEDIDTRTDVYSLGVLLYQLLTGEVPFHNLDPKRVGLLEMYRIIREEEPERPSSRISSSTDVAISRASKRRLSSRALRKNLQGELDWIVMRALAKDPEDRYESAMAMAVDLNHYMHGEPVIAGPGSTTYRLSRLIRKYRIHFAAGAILFAVGLACAVLVWIYAFEAYQESTRADEEFTNAEGWKTEALKQQARATRLQKVVDQADARLESTTNRLQGHVDSKTAEVRELFARYDQVSRAFNEATMRSAFLILDARRRSMQQVAASLQPAHPSMVAALQQWEKEGSSLVAALPRVHLLRRTLEAKVRTRSDRSYLDGIRRATALQRAHDLANKTLQVAESTILHDVAGDAARCDAEAWPLVDPQRAASAYGKEGLGLALAQRAVELAPDNMICRAQRTLAWALFANGRHTDALAASQAALRAAPFDEKVDYRNDLQSLRAAIELAPETLAAAHTDLDRLERSGPTRPDEIVVETADRDLYHTLLATAHDLATWNEPGGLLIEMRSRLQWARVIGNLTHAHPNARTTWADARAAIKAADGRRASQLYAHHPIDDLQPQLGLVPIGMNPKTKLWEFYHLRSAWNSNSKTLPKHLPIPDHGAGSSEVTDHAGILFVLVPGGRFAMGRNARDSLAIADSDGNRPTATELKHLTRWYKNEVGAHQIELEPYFLARHELTTGQYRSIVGSANPPRKSSGESDGQDPRLPMHGLTFLETARLLGAHGLVLPTEAQWEYACRAGHRRHWSTGDQLADLRGHANLFDAKAQEQYPPPSGFNPRLWSDASPGRSRVGSLTANDFGFFDMHGNLTEWCLDRFGDYSLPTTPGTGERRSNTERRVVRGGSFLDIPMAARTTTRGSRPAGFRSHTLGLRPSRKLMK